MRARLSIQAFGNLRNESNAGLRYANLTNGSDRTRWNNGSRHSD